MERLRDSWDGTKLSFEKDLAYGFSWPQRNYICSFCKKEFKSAQALGGHMNMHRRDRARLRDSPNPNPNPNPNLAAKVAAPILAEKKVSLFEYPKHDICGSGEEGGKNKGGMLEFTTRMETTVWKASEFLRLDLNVDLPNEELDLELRLGFSN